MKAYLAIYHVATDHKPLTTGKNFESSTRSKTQLNRVIRTWQFISEITTDLRHVSGEENPVADALSRNPVNACKPNSLISKLAKMQKEEGIYPQKEEVWPDHWQMQEHFGYKIAVDVRQQLPRPIVPKQMRKEIFETVHNLGHLGVKASRKAISKSYIWPNMCKDITYWVKNCQSCQSSKVNRHNKASLQHFPSSSGKFQDIHVDIVGPLPINQGNSYLLTIVDRFSRWPAAIPMRGISARDCAQALLEGWIQYYGTPLQIVTDRGRQFVSGLWEELCLILGTVHHITTSYHPQANGMVERFHRQLKASLMAHCEKNENWKPDLPSVLLAIRTAVKEDLGFSSSQLVFGETLRLPGLFFPESIISKPSQHDYLKTLCKSMTETKYKQPQWHRDQIKTQSLKDLKTCTHVFVLVSSVKAPLQRPYQGPYLVLERRDKVYKLQKPDGTMDTVSIDRLKPAHVYG